MSRGWESKDVESQQEQRAEDKRVAEAASKVTADEAELQRKRGPLELDRTRILREIEATGHPRRKAQLEAALKHLEEELGKL
jgi:hypothetical protein